MTDYDIREDLESKYCPDCPSIHDNYLCDNCPHGVIPPVNQEIDTPGVDLTGLYQDRYSKDRSI